MDRIKLHLIRAGVLAATAVIALAGCTSSGGGPARTSRTAPLSSPSTTDTSSPAPGSTSSQPSGSTSTTSTSPVVHQKLTNVHIADVTFVGTQGWLLGTADCLSGSGTGCTAIEHSSDSGRTWTSMTSPAGVHVVAPGANSADCPNTCLTGIRYATSKIGYLFGSGQYDPMGGGITYQTTDGGQHWSRESGGADALEIADGTVLRVADGGGCPPGCTYTVLQSPVGNLNASHEIRLPGAQNDGAGVLFGRSGRLAYLLSLGHVAGGGDTATSVLWTSTNDGASWARRGEPCPQRGSEYDSTNLSVGPDGSVAVLCRQRGGAEHNFVASSADGGAHFAAAPTTSLGAAQVTAIGAVSASTILVSSDDTYRSTDGGDHFSRLSSNGGSSPGRVAWIGFSSATVGHAISTDRRTVWNTTDGGRTWTRATLH